MIQILNDIFNPLIRFGRKKYSSRLPTFGTLMVIASMEVVANYIVGDPQVINATTVPVFIALVVYFSFRDGVLGGSIATMLAIIYYVYIIKTRNYSGDQLDDMEYAIIVLGLTYLTLATTIGWLRQKIDSLVMEGREGERRLKTILNQLPIGIVVRNRKGVMEITNRQLDRLFNINMIDSREFLAKIMDSDRQILNREYKIRRPDGKQAFIHASAVTIVNDNNQKIGSAAIISDVSRLKEIEKRKDDFVNMASHELKTPITSMKLYLDLLSTNSQSYDPETKQIIDSLRLQTNRLQKLASDLVDASRITAGKFSFNKKSFNLNQLMEEIISDLDRIVPSRKIMFVKRQTITILADRFRIYQVLSNIITNALKYSPTNSPVEVRLEKRDSEAIVSVRDFGVGITKDQQKKIFQRLYQVNTDKQNTFPGLGMGLFISKEIIKRHKGKIWVESTKGKGSTFYFSLPILAKAVKVKK